MLTSIIESWSRLGRKWGLTALFLTLLGGIGGCSTMSLPPSPVPLEGPSREGDWGFHVHRLTAPHRDEMERIWRTCRYPYPLFSLTSLPPVPLVLCLDVLKPL